MIVLDGSIGEGGGQILRTALSLSVVTGKPFRIEKIRAGRERGGLLRQHLAAVLAATEISGAEVEGAYLGSTSLTFEPGPVKHGDYHFAIGTAGSGTLLLQTVLPALMLAKGPSTLTIEGGTHNMAAPPFDFIERTFLPLINRMGPKVSVGLEKFGFYPAGGGRFTVEIEPCSSLQQLVLEERGTTAVPKVNAVIANLKHHIAEREVNSVAHLMKLPEDRLRITATKSSQGPGNVVMVEVETEHMTEIFTAFGKMGVSAEAVGTEAARLAQAYLASEGAACEHLADQLLLPMALSGGGAFTTTGITGHTRTNMDVIGRFLDIRFRVEENPGSIRISLC